MSYILKNEKNGKYFARENKYLVCVEVEDMNEAMKYDSMSLAIYKECLLKESYKIMEVCVN